MTNRPQITLLTCTRNGESTIRQVLEAIANQTDVSASLIEVLVIDNASTDRTAAVAAETIRRLNLNGRVLSEPQSGKMNAFLKGLHEANSPLLSIIDDDNFIEPGFVRYTLALFDRYPDVGIVGSTNRIAIDAPVPEWFSWVSGRYACAQPWLSEIDSQDAEGVRVAQTGAIAGAGSTFRVKPLRECLNRGYSFFNDLRSTGKTTVTGEDIELCWLFRSLGYRFAHDPRIQLRHAIKPERLNLDYFASYSRAIGAGSLGIDPFIFTRKQSDNQYPIQWTWQWQLVTKLKQYFRLLFQKIDRANEEQQFRSWISKLECWGAIERILAERSRYTAHIRQVAAGEWTELRRR